MGPSGGSTFEQALADLKVTISTPETEPVVTALDLIKARLDRFAQQFAGLNQVVGTFAASVQRLVGGVAATVSGLVTAGVALSSSGQQISIRMQQLSLQVASLFTPEIGRATQALTLLVGWMRGLSGEQQRLLAMLGGAAVGLSALALAAPRVVAGMQAVRTAVYGVQLALAAMSLNPWVLAIVAVVAAVVLLSAHSKTLQAMWVEIGTVIKNALEDALVAVKAIAAGIDDVAAAMGKVIDGDEKQKEEKGATGRWWDRFANDPTGLRYNQKLFGDGWGSLVAATPLGLSIQGGQKFGWWGEDFKADRQGDKPHQTLAPRLGGFESLDHTWQRIAIASRDATGGVRSPEQQTADNTQKTAKHVENIDRALAGVNPGSRAPGLDEIIKVANR